MNIKLFKHSSIKIDNIYIDPYQIDVASHDAKYIFITHSHYDHFSMVDIQKLWNENTTIIAPEDVIVEIVKSGLPTKYLTVNQHSLYMLDDLVLRTFPSYNINKEYHPKDKGWVGYVITYENMVFVVLGDTDLIPEITRLKCDVLFVPIGGKYTMNSKEASNLTNILKPKLVIPTHYNLIVGSKKDEKDFINGLERTIKYKTFN